MIHQYRHGQWLPGEAGREGRQPFPAHPVEGSFFSDVTGRAGSKPEAVADTLASLAMKQGALSDWLPVMPDWAGLMGRVREAFLAADRQTGSIVNLVLNPKDPPQIIALQNCDRAVEEQVAAVALALLKANGQMDHLRRQAWYADGLCEVLVRIDAQLGRHRDQLQFHKDNDGHILFNNLVFRNDAAVLATEWSFDLQAMSPARKAALQHSWPTDLLTGIEKAREALRVAHPSPRIEGGVLPGDGVVSWVEELIWHATPVAAHRPVYERAGVLATLKTSAWSPEVADILVQIAETPGSRLATWLAQQHLPAQGLIEPALRTLWQRVHAGSDAEHLQELLWADATAIDWSHRPRATATLVIDTYDPSTQAPPAQRQSSGMLGRPRSNSDQIDALKAVVDTDQPRDFLRISVLLADPS